MIHSLALITTLALFALVSCDANGRKSEAMDPSPQSTQQISEPSGKVNKSEDEWRRLLSAEQYHILRETGTERPNGRAYKEFKQQGVGNYHCAGCNALLFSSKEKFESGCGWPSFYDPAKAENVETRTDSSLGMTRVEVLCARCGGHLGHVFTGEGFDTPTDRRYCINGGGLRFVPNEGE